LSRAAHAFGLSDFDRHAHFGDDHGVAYIVTELVDGESLSALLDRGPVPLKRALEIAVQVADALRGKDTAAFTPHLDAGAFVVVINAEKVVLSGNKENAKQYMSYSGWKGGERYRSVPEIRARHPQRLIEHAVRGMLPKNRLGSRLFTKLKVYAGAKHPHTAQVPAEMKYAG